MYSFPALEPVCCSMSGSNCCFLTCIQVSQEASEMTSFSHLFKNFPVCCDPHKGFGIVNKAEVYVFLELSCFFYDPKDVGKLIFDSSAFSKSNVYFWKFMYCWSLTWRILSITLLVCELNAIVVVWTVFGIAFLWDWNENWPFPVLQPLLSFPNLLAYWV